MNINVAGGEARQFSMNGSLRQRAISIGGFDLAGASGSSTNRGVLLDQVSLNNISRIEVLHTPTPESPGMAWPARSTWSAQRVRALEAGLQL